MPKIYCANERCIYNSANADHIPREYREPNVCMCGDDLIHDHNGCCMTFRPIERTKRVVAEILRGDS